MRFPVSVILVLVLAAATGFTAGLRAETIRISRTDCQRLVEHKARDDVAYRPGVDVRGRKVVPAEGPDAPDMSDLVPDMLEFSVALNPLKGGAARFGETSLTVGVVRFDMKTRRATLGGVPLTRGDTATLLEECRRAVERK